MKGQINLFAPDFIRDVDCTKDTPVIYGKEDASIYGTGKRIQPRVSGREDSEHMKKIFLPELLPLEEYDLIAILLSGGKDSIACYYKLLELGVPKAKMEFWHHDIDGRHPCRQMDWRCTHNYVKALSEAEEVPLRLSWRVNGFSVSCIGLEHQNRLNEWNPIQGKFDSANFLKIILVARKSRRKPQRIWKNNLSNMVVG